MNRLMRAIGALSAGLILAAGYAWYNRRATDESLVLYGNVDVREVEMAFRQRGRLLAVHVDEGDITESGRVLAELDDKPFRDAVAVAEAARLQAAAELDKLRHGNRVQEILQAEQAVRRAEAALKFAIGESKRQGAVVSSGATTKQAYDHAHAARDQAEADLASARQAWALLKEGARAEDLAAAKARLSGAEAALEQARTALADTRVAAPAHAEVLARVREPGSMVDSGAPILTLSLRDPVYVRAYIAEPQLGRAVPGTHVVLRTDSSSRSYHGQIGFVSPRAEFTPKAVETSELRTALVYRLRIVVSDADASLRQGMPVTVSLPPPQSGK
ncbi:MAG: secretion protein HlyD [Methylotetracoccus sp.]